MLHACWSARYIVRVLLRGQLRRFFACFFIKSRSDQDDTSIIVYLAICPISYATLCTMTALGVSRKADVSDDDPVLQIIHESFSRNILSGKDKII